MRFSGMWKSVWSSGAGRRRADQIANRGREQRAAHHEGQGRIPGPEQIEKGEDPGRIGHAGERETGAEQQAGQNSGNEDSRIASTLRSHGAWRPRSRSRPP